MLYFNGLTQWHHPHWYPASHSNKHSLNVYSQSFNSVEGNNTFYGVPSANSIDTWKTETPETFRFCFKFPRTITHDAMLQNCRTEVNSYLQRIEPLETRIGTTWLQMAKSFSPQHLAILETFLTSLPKQFTYGIEVRNLGFFDKSDTEKHFNQLLMQYDVNRVIFDTRTLFSNPAKDDDSVEALINKPKVPTHVIATAKQPLIRFISPTDTSLADKALDQWANKFIEWIDEGRTPYIFFHTPDKIYTPDLAQRFSTKLHQLKSEIPVIKLWNKQDQQSSLF